MKQSQLIRQTNLDGEAPGAMAGRRLEIKIRAGRDETQSTLDPGELNRLEECENILQRGLHTFFEVGLALLTIRDERLYRAKHHTFESYCIERWGMGRSYAWRLMGTAERLKLLPPDGTMPKPTSECQVRPFLRIEPQLFPKAWEQAVARAKGGKITPKLLKSLIAEFRPTRLPVHAAPQRDKHDAKPAKSRIGEALTWLYETRRRIEHGEKEEALNGLERVEAVLQRLL